MPTLTLISHPNWFRLAKGKSNIDMKVDKFVFQMEFTKHVTKMLDENPVFQAKLWEPASKVWNEMLDTLFTDVKGVDAYIKKMVRQLPPDKFEEDKTLQLGNLQNRCEKNLAKYRQKMAKAVDDEWAKIRKQNKLANTFKLKTVFKAVGRTVAVTSSVLALVASGGLNFVAYFTLARSITTSVSELKSLCKNIDKLGGEVKSDLESFSKSVCYHPKLKKAKDISNTLTFGLLGAEFAKTYTSINRKIGTLRARVAIMQQKQIKLGKDIKKLMDKIDKEKSKADKTSQEMMVKLQKTLNTLLEKVSKLGEQVQENDVIATKCLKHLKSLQKNKGQAILTTSQTILKWSANITKFVLSAVVLDMATAGDAVTDIAESLSKS